MSLSVWLWLTIWKSTGVSPNHMSCFKLCLFQCGDPAHRSVWAYQREHHNVNTWDTPYLSKTAHALAPGWMPWVQIEDAIGLWQMVCSTSTLVINYANKGKICLVWFSCIAIRHLALYFLIVSVVVISCVSGLKVAYFQGYLQDVSSLTQSRSQ